MTANQIAFLAMISHAEGTDRVPDPYRCCYGFHYTIASLLEHPAVSGEWRGESLASLGPRYEHAISTAAGRYQITRPTWLIYKNKLQLGTFGPEAQDAVALSLIADHGALFDVEAGNIAIAISLCAGVWASLPGSHAQQPQRDIVSLAKAYTNAGGRLA